MAKLIIHQEKVADNQELVKICPFGAMEEKDGKLTINAACDVPPLRKERPGRCSGICRRYSKTKCE